MPLTVDLQISAQVAFPLEPGFLKQANAPCIVWNTGCFNTVQLKPGEDIRNNQLKCGKHMALAGKTLAHPIADHEGIKMPVGSGALVRVNVGFDTQPSKNAKNSKKKSS